MNQFLFLRTICIFSFVFAWSGSTVAADVDCRVSGAAVLPGGEVFDGTFSQIDGNELIDWTHDAPGFLIEVTDVTTPAPLGGSIICRGSGTTTGDVFIEGKATLNGVPVHAFRLSLQDNRPPPDLVTLVASLSYYPTNRTDGVTNFDTPKTVTIPAEIPVRAGGSASGKTRLILDNDITCTYLGAGSMYVFDRCNDSLDSGYVAGDSLDISHAVLRIQQADRSFALTSVEAELRFVTAPGLPDSYTLYLQDSSGGLVYSIVADVIRGDIDIDILP